MPDQGLLSFPLVVGEADHNKARLAIRDEVNAVRNAAAKELRVLAGGGKQGRR